MIRNIESFDPDVYRSIQNEKGRQNQTLEMIASENFVSPAVLEAVGCIMTNKYAEGYPGHRYYGGCEYVDVVENLARERAKELFKCAYANVQPHSGSQANMAVYFSLLKPGDTMMGMNLAHGGHLTHGSPVNFSGKMYKVVSYGVKRETGRIDYDEVVRVARAHRPRLIIAGASAYPRFFEYERFREIADEIGAYLMSDMAHPAGLIAAGVHPSPIPYCDVVTSTTHKTLRGPRAGLILMGKDFENRLGITAPKSGRVKMMSEVIDGMVMPGIQGGPLMHIIAAKAVAFKEALQPEFHSYAEQVVRNAKTLGESLKGFGFNLVSGGTDNHLLLIDLTNKNITGKAAEESLERAGITVNKNMVPFDQQSPFTTSGIRIGLAALTTRGMKESEMNVIGGFINRVIAGPGSEENLGRVKKEIFNLTSQFPLYV
jgi:glycine hydroxymethyltransferase